MTHSGKISLKTIYDSVPPTVTVTVGQEILFNDILAKDTILDFNWHDDYNFKIQITKIGKTMGVIKKQHQQEVVVENLSLNGFNLHPEIFGQFKNIGNTFVADSNTQTNKLDLNGEWTLDVPLFPLHGVPTIDDYKEFRDPISDSETACFGCSFTSGTAIEKDQTWPSILASLTGDDVKNYGIGGSNNQEIVANAYEYVKNYKTKNVIMLLCHFCRLQILKDGKVYNWHPTSDIGDLFPVQMSKMVSHSETSLLFAGQVPYFLYKLNEIKSKISGNVYVSTYIEDHYKCLEKIKTKDFVLLPFYEMSKDVEFASDNLHPGPEHNRLFAESVVQYINK
jgi:hypothetical protein|tara:strand:+ start:606 stop:1616 length:1011 start_codon:yes stop_codon:yes gene_type:complete